MGDQPVRRRGPFSKRADPLKLVRYREPSDHFAPTLDRKSWAEDQPSWRVQRARPSTEDLEPSLAAGNSKQEAGTLQLYFGDLHEHSDLSVCNRVGDETGEQTYQMMREMARFDFGAITDHGYGFVPYLWNYQRKLVSANDDPGVFRSLLAEEWTSSFETPSEAHPYGY